MAVLDLATGADTVAVPLEAVASSFPVEAGNCNAHQLQVVGTCGQTEKTKRLNFHVMKKRITAVAERLTERLLDRESWP